LVDNNHVLQKLRKRKGNSMHIVFKHLYPDAPVEPIRQAAEQELLPLFKAVRQEYYTSPAHNKAAWVN